MAIYYNGSIINPTLIVPHDIYDNAQQSGATVTLTETDTVYIVTPTAATTLVFNTDNLQHLTTKFVTFMLVIDCTNGVQEITWPTNVQWGNITPTMTANVKYMFSFTKPAGEDVWIGNQMYSWQ